MRTRNTLSALWILSVVLGLTTAIFSIFAQAPPIVFASSTENKATIAVLSHTDFLPDATGVYDRRSWQGRDKNPAFAANNDLRTGQDQAYDNLNRQYAYNPESVGLPELLADGIIEQLSNSKRFLPVERKSLRTAVIEQRFGEKMTARNEDGSMDRAIQELDTLETNGPFTVNASHDITSFGLQDFQDLGQAVGARYIILGNLHQLGSGTTSKQIPLSESGRQITQKNEKARIRIRVIDTLSSTVVGADSIIIEKSSFLLNESEKNSGDYAFLEHVSSEAANKILDIVFPAKVVSTVPLIISRGTNDGIAEGAEFSISREGKEITEETGVVIAKLKTAVGKVQVTEVQDTISIVTPTQGADFKKGDLASRIYPPIQSNLTSIEAVPLHRDNTSQNIPRLAIGLVKTGSTAETGPDAAKHVPTFTDTIISRFTQSRRFLVIDRQEVDQLLDEQTAQSLAAGQDLPSAMGTLKGCDYLMLGSLQNFSMEEQSIKLPNSSKVMEVLDGFAEGNMRLVDCRSGDIMESRKIVTQKQLDLLDGEDRLVANLADDFAAQIVANLLNAVYPLKVAAVGQDNAIYVNRGSDGMLQTGMTLDVLRPGQMVNDPDTGIALGTVDSKVATVELTTIEDNRSIGKLIAGSPAKAGDILKVTKQNTPSLDITATPQRTGPAIPSGAIPRGETHQMASTKTSLAVTRITFKGEGKLSGTHRTNMIQQGTMDHLTDIVGDALADTNRFTLMERRQVDQILDEKSFIAIARGGDIRDYLKELQGADYIVIGELTNFYLQASQNKIPYLDKVETIVTAHIEGNQRIVDTHSGETAATSKIRLKKQYKNETTEEIRTNMIDKYAKEFTDSLVIKLYPTKILGVLQDGTIYINRGTDGNIKVGDTFSVGRPVFKLTDPDTGQSFGDAEQTIGTLEITAVELSRAKAKMVTGTTPQGGDILRDQKPAEKPLPTSKMKVNW